MKLSPASGCCPQFICEVLQQYKTFKSEQYLKLGRTLDDNDYLFPQDKNLSKPMHPDTISSWFPEFLEKHELPKVKFHGLRHTHASLLMALDMDVTSAAGRLGHSQKSTFLNIYSHMLKSRDEEASEKLNELFSGSDKFGHILDTLFVQK